MADKQTEQQPHLSILRIKRKRTDQPTPLDALVIEHAQPPSTKRRKNNPADPAPEAAPAPSRGIFRFAETVPLDSFSTPTKTRSLRDRIQSFLAHPPPALSRQHSSASLRSLARDRDRESSPSSLKPPPTNAKGPGSPARRKLPSALRAAREAAASGSSSSAPPSPLGPSTLATTSSSFGLSPSSRASAPHHPPPSASRAAAAHASRAALRYRVVERRRAESYALVEERAAREADEVRRGLRPPTVRDAREVEREREERERDERERDEGWRIYEAVAEGGEVAEGEGEGGKKAGRGRKGTVQGGHKAPQSQREPDDGGDSAMDRFGEMLDEYLSLQESITPSSPTAPPTLSAAPTRSRAPAPAPAPASNDNNGDGDDDGDSDDDSNSDSGASFVYDVYYRAAPARAPVGASAPSAGPQRAVESSEVPGGEGGAAAGAWDVSSLAGLTRIGQLAGLDPDEDDAALLLLHSASALRAAGGEGGSGDSDEEEDNADQDSNEENDYRNDYPDEEDADAELELDEGFDADDAAAWRESVRGVGPRGGAGAAGGEGGGWSDDEDEEDDDEGEGDDEGMSDEGWSD
ncbi:hypothetical protein JCM8208_002673 [Rhodotorula glutinis]